MPVQDALEAVGADGCFSVPTGDGPGVIAAALADDAALEQLMRRYTIGGWHASGTCRMGAPDDPMAVVDPRTGRVHGVDGLSVVDASIMPTVPRANINIPTIMLAEKMADAILHRSQGR
jgi:5-(hydroxymethyl)furfural/furfural oxidase